MDAITSLEKSIAVTEDIAKAHVKEHMRRTKSGGVTTVKEHEANLHHPAYNTAVKLPKHNRAETPKSAVTAEDAAKILVRNNPAWTKEDHKKLAAAHEAARKEHDDAWGRVADEAAQKTWGRKFEATDYKVSGIGSSEFSDEHKELLRHHAHSASAHSKLTSAHTVAARRVKE